MKKAIFLGFLLTFNVSFGKEIVSTITHPTTCNATDGSITFSGLIADTTYTVLFDKDSFVRVNFGVLKTGHAGILVLQGLESAKYSHITFKLYNANERGLEYGSPIFLSDGCHFEVSKSDPTKSLEQDGSIVINGLRPETEHQVSIQKIDKRNIKSKIDGSFKSDSKGRLVISGLSSGSYTEFLIDDNQQNFPQINLTDNIGYVAPNQQVQWDVSVFSNIKGIQDDNPPTYTETYLRLSIPLNRQQGIKSNSQLLGERRWSKEFKISQKNRNKHINSNTWRIHPNEDAASKNDYPYLASRSHRPLSGRIILSRNLYFQGNYATNVADLKAVYNDTGSNPIRYVNALDLLKYEKFKLSLRYNIFTYIVPKSNWDGDIGHLYVDGVAAVMSTSIADSNKSMGSPFLAKSLILGSSIKYKSTNLSVAGSKTPLGFELGVSFLWINAFSDNVNTTLNAQYSDRVYQTIANGLNKGKTFTVNNQVYQNIDLLVYYNTGKKSDTLSSSNFYFHLSYFGNFPAPSSSYMNNSYLQLQIGYSLSLNKFISNFTN